MLPERVMSNGSSVLAEDFAQPGLDKDTINSRYFSRRDKLALALLNGFPSFVYYVPNFRWDQVGTYSLEMLFGNLTSEVPDVRFVPLIEAGLYFGNRWMRVQNAIRDGSVIEFDIDASAVPNVVSIGKGMLWLRVNANESIQEVSINNNRWFYFDEHSIRLPTPEGSVHVRVILGASPSPRVDESRYKVVGASYDGYRFNVSIAATENLNVSVRMSIPKMGAFSKDNWNVFCLETTPWNYNFSLQDRSLEFWAITDGFTSFEVGVFWIIDPTPPWYDSPVTVSANYSGLELEITQVLLCYNLEGDTWTNVTAALQSELWVATIPAKSYGALVRYRLFAYASIAKWFITEVFSYNVIDETAPEIDGLEWGPGDPAAGQPVNVRVDVSEPLNASGVKEVVLRYYLGTDVTDIARAQTVIMNNQDGTWVAEIPGQSGGSMVTFSMIVRDNAGNRAETSAASYNVSLLPVPLWLFLLMICGVIVVGLAVGVYFFKFRKPKLKADISESKK